MNTRFKVGDVVYDSLLTKEKGIVTVIEPHCLRITVLFENDNNSTRYYNFNGALNFFMAPTLSFKPYTLQGFTQEREIEKGTLVYVRRYRNGNWGIRFYSHKENGMHFCFVDQLKNGAMESWNYVETENPLL